MKFYFETEDSDECFNKKHFVDQLKESGEKQITVFEAVPDNINTEWMYCRAVGEVGLKTECGRYCEDYSPRNGKSGICKHQGKLHLAGEEVIIKI